MSTIEILLEAKGRFVATVPPDTDLHSAIQSLTERSIGALVVVNTEGNPIGIISERDILRFLVRLPKDLHDAKVKHIMTHNPVTASPDDELDTVMGLMTDNRFRHLPIMKDGKLCGIVSIGDVVKRLKHERERQNKILTDYMEAPYPG